MHLRRTEENLPDSCSGTRFKWPLEGGSWLGTDEDKEAEDELSSSERALLAALRSVSR